MQLNNTTLSRLQTQASALQGVCNQLSSHMSKRITLDNASARFTFRVLEVVENLKSIQKYKPVFQYQHTQAARLEQLAKEHFAGLDCDACTGGSGWNLCEECAQGLIETDKL